MIYLDNSSTSFPKPTSVCKAVSQTLNSFAVNPGRGGYALSQKADRFLYEARLNAASFFGVADASRLIFTPGCTHSINMAIKGLLNSGDHVLMTGRMHNAMQRAAKGAGLNITQVKWNGRGNMPERLFTSAVKTGTKAILLNHGSNVDGLLFPLKRIGKIAKKLKLKLIVDAAQTAGLVPINMAKAGITALAVPAHKGLLAPAGSGILAIASGEQISTIIEGGTGSFSETVQMPENFPDRLEAGSLNLIGIAGLNAGIKYIQRVGIKNIFAKKLALTTLAEELLQKIPNIQIFWQSNKTNRLPLFSFIIKGQDPAKTGDMLNEAGIACRVGLHCSPHSHMEIGSYPEGAVRFSPGIFTTKAEVKKFAATVKKIAAK